MYNFIRTHLEEVRHYPGKEMRTIYGYITISALTVLTAGCGISRLQAPAGTGRDAGPFVTRVYEGHIQCTHGQERTCRLTVRYRLHSGDGTFRLILKQDGKGTERYSGRRFTLRGTRQDNDATVWQCVSSQDGRTFDFLVGTDSTLVITGDTPGKGFSACRGTLKLTRDR